MMAGPSRTIHSTGKMQPTIGNTIRDDACAARSGPANSGDERRTAHHQGGQGKAHHQKQLQIGVRQRALGDDEARRPNQDEYQRNAEPEHVHRVFKR